MHGRINRGFSRTIRNLQSGEVAFLIEPAFQTYGLNRLATNDDQPNARGNLCFPIHDHLLPETSRKIDDTDSPLIAQPPELLRTG
jgi:hypothetical protein